MRISMLREQLLDDIEPPLGFRQRDVQFLSESAPRRLVQLVGAVGRTDHQHASVVVDARTAVELGVNSRNTKRLANRMTG